MIQKKVKNMAKDAMIIGVTGIGLGVVSGLGGGAAVGKMAGGLGTVGGVVMASHTIDILDSSVKKISKKTKW